MHLVPFLRCPADIASAELVLQAVVEAGVPVSVAVRPSVLSSLDPDLVERSRAAPIEWVRTGFGEPWFAMLPDAEIQRQLVREETALRGAGLVPGPLLVSGPWARHLPSSLARADVRALILPATGLDAVQTGVVSHLDAVLPVVPLVMASALDGLEPEHDDAVAVAIPPDDPVGAVRLLAARPHSDVTCVERFFAHHIAAGRRLPEIPDWEQRLTADPDRGVLHRKLIALVRRIPERLSDEAEQALLEAESGRGFEATSDPLVASAAMVTARRVIEAERRRGADWARVNRLDWDADGRMEMHIELAELSMVLAPSRSGAMPVLDHKPSGWPVSTVAGEPGWSLVRMVGEMETGASMPVELAETSVTERRGGTVVVSLTGEVGDGGRLDVTLEATGARMSIRYDGAGLPPAMIGPELKVSFALPAEVRVDGSRWQPVEGPRAVSGHRFRLSAGDRQLLVSSLTPASMFLRPGVEGTGLVVWPHWAVAGDGTHEMAVELLPGPPSP